MLLAGVGATGLALALISLRHRRWRQQHAAKLANLIKLDLLPGDKSFAICQSAPTSTATFFTGDTAAAQQYFSKRVAEIVSANPWLASVLDRDPGSGAMAVYYPPPGADADAAARGCFEVRGDIALSRGSTPSTYIKTVAALAPALCKTSIRSVGSGTPLWRVCVVPDAHDPGGRFALVVSANHSLLDGHGYYAVYNMLCAKADVRALSPVRKQELTAKMLQAMGGEPSLLQAAPMGFMLRFIGGGIWNAIFPATCALGFHVSDAWVGAQKAAAKEAAATLKVGSGSAATAAPFVSTNDVLVSAFCVALRPTLATMAINLRGRVQGCEEGDVGNYEDVISFAPADYSSPLLIRKSVAGGDGRPYARAADPPTRMPTNWEHVRGATYAAITNWATFAGALTVPGAEQSLHLPLFDFPATTPAKVFGAMVIFRPGAGKGTAVLVAGTRQLIEAVEASGMVGRPLEMEM
ncbi:hypothetical protein FOA52_012412 [Chlamydomonas sp. UWO 241]|nr:hypothetical protein FOA52_012412 [Chlamydomonas sp. UWO 241]